MKHILISVFVVIFVSCNQTLFLTGKYYNTKNYFDSPINIISLEKNNYFEIVYPSVIGEKESGIWKKSNDTLTLYIKYNIVNSLKDTILREKDTICQFIITKKELKSITNQWLFKRFR